MAGDFPISNWKEFYPQQEVFIHPRTVHMLPPETPNTKLADYACLQEILSRAYEQAASGKGSQRHAQGQPFFEQPMQKLIDLYGVGFALGQAGKKMQESQRLDKDAGVRELLGAIVYIAGAIISMEKQ